MNTEKPNPPTRLVALLAAALATFMASTLLTSGASAADFVWKDKKGKHRDLYLGGRAVARYVYEPIDESSPERRDATYKPFHHLYAWWKDDQFLTKGPGGKFPHHRGIFYGFSKCSYVDGEGETHQGIDTWHCRQAHQVHREFFGEKTDGDSVALGSRIDWVDNAGEVFATEERTLTFSYSGSDLVIDFHSVLTPKVPRLRLDGDPQHAGFQFRASNFVAEESAKDTYYLRPDSGRADPGETINWSEKNDSPATRDLPWKGMCFRLDEDRYTVLYIDSPNNPKPARYSERDYGRFGSYFVADLTPEEPLEVNYRLLVRKGEIRPEVAPTLAEKFAIGGE